MNSLPVCVHCTEASAKTIHIAKSLEKPTARPKLGNKYTFANAEKDANKIGRNERNEESTSIQQGV